MLRKQAPFWVFFGSFSLTLFAGATNAVGFLSVAHQGMTHVTGTVTLSSIELAKGNIALAFRALTVVIFFFFGAALSGAVIRDSHLRTSRRYGVALIIESASSASTSRRRHAAFKTHWPPATAGRPFAPRT